MRLLEWIASHHQEAIGIGAFIWIFVWMVMVTTARIVNADSCTDDQEEE